MRTRSILAAMIVLSLAVSAAALSPADRCEADKLKRAGKYNFCRMKAESRAVKAGTAPDYALCDLKLSQKWAAAESRGGGQCPTNGDLAVIAARIGDDTDDLVACLNGACPPPPVPPGFPATGQVTSYGSGSDGDVQAGAPLTFVDNGDGTITDINTGLMWEKKSDDGSVHDWDDLYAWGQATPPYLMNGPMVTTFLHTLNDVGGGGANCFAGHCDWRMPNRKELESIVDLESHSPAVAAAFNDACVPGCDVTSCSCIKQSSFYWTSTTYAQAPIAAWVVNFVVGNVFADVKSGDYYVRAVRGGL